MECSLPGSSVHGVFQQDTLNINKEGSNTQSMLTHTRAQSHRQNVPKGKEYWLSQATSFSLPIFNNFIIHLIRKDKKKKKEKTKEFVTGIYDFMQLWNVYKLFFIKSNISRNTLFVRSPFLIHGILQATILEWVAIAFSRGSFQPRDQTWVFCIAGRFLTIWATRGFS